MKCNLRLKKQDIQEASLSFMVLLCLAIYKQYGKYGCKAKMIKGKPAIFLCLEKSWDTFYKSEKYQDFIDF